MIEKNQLSHYRYLQSILKATINISRAKKLNHFRRILFLIFLVTICLIYKPTLIHPISKRTLNESFKMAYKESLVVLNKRQLIQSNCSKFSSSKLSAGIPQVPLFTWPSERHAALHSVYNDTIYVATVCCGNHADYLVAFVKSLLLFSANKTVTLYIIVEHIDNVLPLRNFFNTFSSNINHDFVYEVYGNSYKSDETKGWALNFKPCASQKLLLPYALAHVKRVISLDLDTIFLRPIGDIWSVFNQFNKHHIAGLVGEELTTGLRGYDFFARHPFPPPAGLNVGVILMDLAHMRKISWFCLISNIINLYSKDIIFFDQDIVNIYFFFHPQALVYVPCSFNYRTDHCERGSICVDAVRDGVGVLHGNRNVFLNSNQPVFRSLHSFFLKEDITQSKPLLLKKMKHAVSSCKTSSCTAPDVYTIGFIRTIA